MRIKKIPLKLFYFFVGKVFSSDQRIAKRLDDYFSTYRSAFAEFLNQALRLAGSTLSYVPQGILIEPTNLCNLRCTHCSTQNSVEDKKGYMDFGLFKKIIDTNPQLTSVILTRNGEPMLHPRIFDMISYARNKNIYVSLYTNGVLLKDDYLDRIFKSGLNELNFSMEGVGESYKKIRGRDYSEIESAIRKVLEERKKRKSPIKIGINTCIVGDPDKALEVKKTWIGMVDHIDIEPLMASGKIMRKLPCRTLWRNLVVTWDGLVIPCCVDMNARLILGDANKNNLREIFNSPAAKALRKKHLNASFPTICKTCDAYFG